MEPKTELLVFKKKEITVIIVLLVLVALFSFTLGLRVGKSLGVARSTSVEPPPLAVTTEPKGIEAKTKASDHEAAEHVAVKAPDVVATPGDDVAKKAEDLADTEFAKEAAKEKIGLAKAIPMSLPEDKKGETGGASRFTLQVGSHRTIAEAAEQVAQLKRSNLDAFYIEAKVPGKGIWYRVGIGVFASKDGAESAGAKWKAGRVLQSFIVQKISE